MLEKMQEVEESDEEDEEYEGMGDVDGKSF